MPSLKTESCIPGGQFINKSIQVSPVVFVQTPLAFTKPPFSHSLFWELFNSHWTTRFHESSTFLLQKRDNDHRSKSITGWGCCHIMESERGQNQTNLARQTSSCLTLFIRKRALEPSSKKFDWHFWWPATKFFPSAGMFQYSLAHGGNVWSWKRWRLGWSETRLESFRAEI